MNWSVWRTGGRRNSYWHLVFRGPEARARVQYDAIREGLKGGSVKLLDGDDHLIGEAKNSKRNAR